jgi:ribosomal protein S18 acetylase RimI-like enzyme
VTTTVSPGFTDDERDLVADLYWHAFRRKLRPAFRDDATGRAVVATTLRPDRALVARTDGRVSGVCGYHRGGHGMADVTWAGLRRHVGPLAALRATLVLLPLHRDERPGALVLDGICVDADLRGHGIGTALLDAAGSHARAHGLDAVRLTVVDANTRARALYDRVGFRPVGHDSLGPLGPVYGVDRVTTLERRTTP